MYMEKAENAFILEGNSNFLSFLIGKMILISP